MKGLKYLIELKDKVSGPIGKITDKVSKALPKLDSLKTKMKGVNREGGNTGGLTSFGNKLGFINNLAKGFLLDKIRQQLYGIGLAAVVAATNVSSANRIINFSTAGQGAENIQFLDKTIRDLNLPIESAYQGFTKVSGAFKDTVLQGAPMRDIFEGVSTATSAMSLNADTSQGIFLALSQMMSKGKISAEELVGQLGERLPGALTIASRAMGVSTSKLMKMMEQGQLMATDFLPAFAKELKTTFGEEALRAAQTPQAAFVRWENTIFRVKAALGENLLPILANLADKFGPMLEAVIPQIAGAFDSFFSYINTSYNILKPVLDALYSIWLQIKEPLFSFLTVLIQVGDVFRSVWMDGIASMLGAIDFGYILGGLFTALIPLLEALKRGYETARPLLVLLGKVAGVIINFLGKVALKIVEGLVIGFTKMANSVTWVYDKIVRLLTAVGILDGKKMAVGVEVNKPKDLFAGLRLSEQKAPGSFGGFGSAQSGSAFSGGNDGGSAAGKTIDSVTRGGSKPTNINIQLGSLISGGFTVQSTNIKEGAEQVEEIVMKALLKVLNGANQVAAV